LESPRTHKKLKGTFPRQKLEDVLSKYPIVGENNLENSEIILLKIPENFIALKKTNFEEALNWRLKTRKIFDEYINKKGYWITEFYSQKKDGKRQNYYLLEER